MIRRKTLVPGKAEDVIHLIRFAPGHQGVAAEAGVRAQSDGYFWPGLRDLPHDAFDLLSESAAAVGNSVMPEATAPLPSICEISGLNRSAAL